MNNCYSDNRLTLRRRAILWLIIVVGVIFAAYYLFINSKINSSVLSLLPKEQTSNIPTELIEGFQNRLDKQLVWLIKPTNDELEPVFWWYQTLKKQSFIGQVNGYFDEQFQKNWGEFAFQYRYQLLDSKTNERLQNRNQLSWIQSQLYSPFSGISVNWKTIRYY